MSWASTTVSTRITSPVGRRRPTIRTATPVTNMASVASMNGAPRIAPTPTSLDDAPAENRIAMIGIIVSGQRRPDRREHGPDGTLGQAELEPEPLDAVGEQLGARQDDDERDGEGQELHRQTVVTTALPIAIAMTSRIAVETPTMSQSSSRA